MIFLLYLHFKTVCRNFPTSVCFLSQSWGWKNENYAGFACIENIPKHLPVPQAPGKIILFITFFLVSFILFLAASPLPQDYSV